MSKENPWETTESLLVTAMSDGVGHGAVCRASITFGQSPDCGESTSSATASARSDTCVQRVDPILSTDSALMAAWARGTTRARSCGIVRLIRRTELPGADATVSGTSLISHEYLKACCAKTVRGQLRPAIIQTVGVTHWTATEAD